MRDYSSVVLCGTLTDKTPPQSIAPEERLKCTFDVTVAGPRTWPISCSAWGNVAAVVDKLREGERVTVRGSLRRYSWTNAQGEKRSRLEVVADSIVPEGVGLVKVGDIAPGVLAKVRVEADKADSSKGGRR